MKIRSIVVFIIMLMMLGTSLTPASADQAWPSPEPIGNFEIATYCGAYCITPVPFTGNAGGEVSYAGQHYILTATHVIQNFPQGSQIYEWAPTYGPFIGWVGPSTQPRPTSTDLALIQLAPSAAPGGGWRPALWLNKTQTQYPVMYGSNNADLTDQSQACFTAWSANTQADGGSECGHIVGSCPVGTELCHYTKDGVSGFVHGGDSGGTVWRYVSGGVELLGVQEGGANYIGNNSYTEGYFIPVGQFLAQWPGMCVTSYTGCP